MLKFGLCRRIQYLWIKCQKRMCDLPSLWKPRCKPWRQGIARFEPRMLKFANFGQRVGVK